MLSDILEDVLKWGLIIIIAGGVESMSRSHFVM